MLQILKLTNNLVLHLILDSQHSDDDCYGSDTEIDSEEEIHTHTKVEIVEGKDNHKLEKKGTFILPKRSKQEVVAGPSGMKKTPAPIGSRDIVSENEPELSGIKKSKRNGCLVTTAIEESNNSEEAVFMFPKRSKCCNIYKKDPTVSKVCYDSDDDTNVDRIIKLDPDSSDDKSSQVNVNEEKVSDYKSQNAEMKNECKNRKIRNPTEKPETEGNKRMCNKYSSSTINMLNKLL